MISGAASGFDMLARRMIASADPKVHARHSFDNFHRHGMLYLNVLRAPDLTCKVYVLKPGWGEPLTDGLLVEPHSHAYSFHSTCVAGTMKNVVYTHEEGGGWNHFGYETPLNGGRGFARRGSCYLLRRDVQEIGRGGTYFLRSDEVHSIIVPTDKPTVLFLCQYRDDRMVTDFYSRSDAPPSTDGLYKPVSEERYAAEVDYIRRLLESQ